MHLQNKALDSLLLGPADGSQVLLFTGSSSRGHGSERYQESQHDSASAIPILSRADRGTAFAHHEARSASTRTSAEPERRRLVLESPSAPLSWSPQPGPSTHRSFRSPQIDDTRFRVPGSVTRQHGRPPSASPLAVHDIRPDDIRSNSSDGFSFDPTTPLVNRPLHIEPSHASGSQGPIVNLAASPRARDHRMSDRKGKRRASIRSPDAYIDSFDWSENRRSAPSPQMQMETGDSLGPPGLLLRSSSPCSHISVATSNETLSVFSFEVNIPSATLETSGSPSGRSAHVAISPPTPQLTISPFTVSSLVENAIPDLSTQNQAGLDGEDNGDNSQDPTLQVPSGDAGFGNLGDVTDVVDLPASVEEHMDSSRALSILVFDDSPSLTRLQSPSPKVASTSRSSTHLPTQSICPSGLDSTLPPRVWPLWSPSLSTHVDQDAPRSTEMTGLGLSLEGIMSPRSHSLQREMTTRAPLRISPHRHAGSIDRQGTTGDDDTFDAPASAPQAQESPSYLRSAVSNLMQQQQQNGGRTRTTNDDAAPLNSPSNILPLPPSPATSCSSSSPTRSLRLQAQPSHRSSPYMSFYPSLTVDHEDVQRQQQQRTLLIPSGLDVPLGFTSGFGRPTPHPSPTRAPAPAPAVIRTPSPSADPRSPISRLRQIPGSIVGLSRLERVSFRV